MSIYRTRTIKRQRRTRAEIDQLDRQIVEVLRTILRDKIEALLPQDALAIARVSEDSERRHIERVAEILEGAS